MSSANPTTQVAAPSRMQTFGSAFFGGGNTMYPVLLALVIVNAVVASRFATSTNLINILEQVSVLGLNMIGLTFFVLIGRLDLSLEVSLALRPCSRRMSGASRCRWNWDRIAILDGASYCLGRG